jgi:hypothetical protein
VTRAEGLGRIAVLARTHNVELSLQPMSQAEMAALFGAVASQSPLSMPWHRIELDPDATSTEVLHDSLDHVDDEDLKAARDDVAIVTSNARDFRDDEPTIVDRYPTCDTEPPPMNAEDPDYAETAERR